MPSAAEAKKQKADALHAMSNCRGATSAERENAKAKLENFKVPLTSKSTPDTIRVWTAEASLRDPNGGRMVHSDALRCFLNHVSEGVWFTSYSVKLSENLRAGDFYNILNWLQFFGLVERQGSKYKVVSTAAVIKLWNRHIESLKIGEMR